jgi:hypothetical protein
VLMPKSPREKLVVKVLIGILGLFVVFFAYRMVAGGGGDPKASTPAIDTGVQTETKPNAPKKKHAKKKNQDPVLQFTGVDPFEPLIAPAPIESPAAAPGPQAPASPAQPGATLVVQGTTLTLVDLPSQDGVQKAQVLVNGILYQLIPGDSFGDGFTLTSVSPPCADFSWGSESFRLCLTA